MEKQLKPDRKYFIATTWIHLTIFVAIILLTAIINLTINLSGGDSQAVKVIWILCIALCAILWIIIYPLVRLWLNNLSYHIEEDRITVHKGIIVKTQQNIPYRAITDFALKRGFYDRILGIGTINIQTAGQSRNATGYEGSLSGLINFEQILAELRAKIKVLHPVSASTTLNEGKIMTDNIILNQLLEEVKQIREIIAKKD
ncbi:MAG: PH domain-containing protein [Chlorobi bacterium]|nr:PH domain-containing protein [Chlorobiota bacterium]